ncbi:hypothetical protein E2542_SST15255 [Spatholobus suberectus]|nr:hypothetical protein E2542_SST15255 [Spatholobus suberectus]
MERNDLYRFLRENFRRFEVGEWLYQFRFYVEVSCRKMQFASKEDYAVAERSCCMDTTTLWKGRMAKQLYLLLPYLSLFVCVHTLLWANALEPVGIIHRNYPFVSLPVYGQ